MSSSIERGLLFKSLQTGARYLKLKCVIISKQVKIHNSHALHFWGEQCIIAVPGEPAVSCCQSIGLN